MTNQITVPRETWDALREAHRKLIRAYVNLLESGRDRIVSLGGICDPVDQMEAGDPALREAKKALTVAASVSHANPETAPPPEGGAITSAANAVSKFVTLINEGTISTVQPQAQGEAVYLVATGETHNGEETYCRYDYPPALSEFERLYTHPQATEYLKQPQGEVDVSHMVNRFLGWNLPRDFNPDCHITFDRDAASYNQHSWPIGTNLLTADQAKAMFEYCLQGAAHPQATEPAANWATYPEKCPITRRDFFMVIEHPELGMAPTYGGPYDSYTIPHMGGKPGQQMHDRELMCHRFDHDLGYWVDDEIIPLRVIHDDFLPEDDSSKASEPVVKDSLTVPAGYKLVPVEPTREMLYAIQNDCDIMPQRGRRVWATMLSTAPEAKQ